MVDNMLHFLLDADNLSIILHDVNTSLPNYQLFKQWDAYIGKMTLK